MNIMHVAHNFDCPLDERELGEDFHIIVKLDRAVRFLQRTIDRAKGQVDSAVAVRLVKDMDGLLDNLRVDSCLKEVMEDAEGFASSAMVRKIRRVVDRAHPAPVVNKDICPECGCDLDELTTSKNARDRGHVRCNACELARRILEEERADEAFAHSQFGAGA